MRKRTALSVAGASLILAGILFGSQRATAGQAVSDGKLVDHSEALFLGECSAVLVGKTTFITAAHCMPGNRRVLAIDANNMGGEFGRVDKPVDTRPAQDLAIWRLKLSSASSFIQLTPATPFALTPRATDKLRWVAWADDRTSDLGKVRVGASGVLFAPCSSSEQEGSLGCILGHSWVGKVTSGNVCRSDSGGGVYLNDSQFVGIIVRQVSRVSSQFATDAAGCSTGQVVSAFDAATVAWIKSKSAGN